MDPLSIYINKRIDVHHTKVGPGGGLVGTAVESRIRNARPSAPFWQAMHRRHGRHPASAIAHPHDAAGDCPTPSPDSELASPQLRWQAGGVLGELRIVGLPQQALQSSIRLPWSPPLPVLHLLYPFA